MEHRETSPGQATDFGPRAWARDLLESDRRYFEADAELFPVPGAVIVALRGAEALAAGCVVHRIDAAQAASDADAWLVDVERRLRALRSSRARVYLDAPLAPLERALERRGYRLRVEFGFARAAGDSAGGIEIELLPAEDESGWSARRVLMHRVGRGPDGHSMDPELWVAMERRKHRAGYMRPYLIRTGGEIVGAVCTAPCGSLLRMKNLVVDPAHRRRGVATATAVCLARLAAEEGFAATGCFALDGEAGLVVYPRAGYRLLARQTEWVRDFEGAATAMTRRSQLLEPGEVEAYWRDGHVIVKGLFDLQESRAWADESDRLWASVPADRGNPRVQWRGRVDGGEIADRIDPVLDISPVFEALARDTRLIAAASRLLDGTAIPFKAKLITKRPGTAGYGLHQDYPYWEPLGLPADDYVNALVAFDPFDGASGTLEVFPGFHREQAPAPPGAPLDADESLVDGRCGLLLVLEPGDVAIFHSLTPHRSGPNRGAHSRQGLFLTYVPSRYSGLQERYERERIDRAR